MADGQPEPGAAVTAGMGVVGLSEGGEQLGQDVRFDADAQGNRTVTS